LIDATGSVAEQISYDAYGNQTLVSGSALSDVGYAAYMFHAASGLDFANARAYDSLRARWLNRDPIGEAGGVNLYGYVFGDPTNRTDPLGTAPPTSRRRIEAKRVQWGDKEDDTPDLLCQFTGYCPILVCVEETCIHYDCHGHPWKETHGFAPAGSGPKFKDEQTPGCECEKSVPVEE
jgi:RHS repeat-associated protein